MAVNRNQAIMAVSAKNFVRKDKTMGSWDPNSSRWDDIYVSFEAPSWYMTPLALMLR